VGSRNLSVAPEHLPQNLDMPPERLHMEPV